MTDSTDNARGPDWEGFGRDLLESWPVRDVDGSELFDAALRNGLIAEIPGGYDPDQHIDAEGICPEAGAPWYEYAFHPARADLATQPDPLGAVKVKPLVWASAKTMRGHDHFADHYIIRGDTEVILECGGRVLASGVTLDEAKAAAQADYAARIRSALEPVPDPLADPRVTALVDALREAQLQIEYLDCGSPRGTSQVVLARINTALAAFNTTGGKNE